MGYIGYEYRCGYGTFLFSASTTVPKLALFLDYHIVQQLDGTKNSIKLPDINRTPIYKLRELVKEALSIPTHQQKLTLGGGNNNTIVLEDWDEERGAMAIAHYPSLHDGATLYLVQLTDEGIHVMFVSKTAGHHYLVLVVICQFHRFNHCNLLSSISLPSCVNIHFTYHTILEFYLFILTGQSLFCFIQITSIVVA